MLKGFCAVLKHELTLYRVTPGTYIFIILSLVALGLATFYLGNIFNLNRASLEPFFQYHPWVFMFFIPAFSMGIWAEEWRRGTIERLLTLPISPAAVMLGKFVAAWLMAAGLLLLTLSMPLTIAYLGEPDWGPVFSGYLGSFLLIGLYLAVSFVCSILTRSQAGSVSFSLLLLFILLAAGWGAFNSIVENILPDSMLSLFAHYSILERYRHFVAGMIDFRDVAFFISLSAFFLATAWLMLQVKLWQKKSFLWGVPILLIGLITLNWGANKIFWRTDVTAENLFTMTDTSAKLVKDLEDELTITYYYSKGNKNVPVPVQQFSRRVQDFFTDMKNLNKAKISIKNIDPEQDVDLELKALQAGIKEVPLGFGEGYYMGVIMNIGGRESVISIVDPARADYLEFDLISGITTLLQTKKEKIGILTELDLGREELRPRFMMELFANYDVEILPRDVTAVPADIDVLIVFLTPFMGEVSVYALDQYLVSGGNVMLFMDPFLRTAPTADYRVPDRNADDTSMDHPADLLRAWGIEYDYNKVVGDKTRAVPVSVQTIGLTTYPMWLFISETEVNQELPFANYINEMFLIEPGFFDRIKWIEGLDYESVLSTSPNAQTVPRSYYDNMDVQMIAGKLEGQPRSMDLSFLLSGYFPSAYEKAPEAISRYIADFVPGGGVNTPSAPEHKTSGSKPGALLAIADMDFLTDEYAMSYQNFRGRQVLTPANDNLVFVVNAIQFLMGDRTLIAIRGKGQKNRTFTRVEDMLKAASGDYQELEQQLAAELFSVNQRIGMLRQAATQHQVGDERVEQEIMTFRQKELDIRKRLRELRRSFRADIEKLNRNLTLLNILLVPFFISIFAGLLFWKRRKRA